MTKEEFDILQDDELDKKLQQGDLSFQTINYWKKMRQSLHVVMKLRILPHIKNKLNNAANESEGFFNS